MPVSKSDTFSGLLCGSPTGLELPGGLYALKPILWYVIAVDNQPAVLSGQVNAARVAVQVWRNGVELEHAWCQRRPFVIQRGTI